MIDYEQLERRIGRVHLERRLNRQSLHVSEVFGPGRTRFHLERMRRLHAVIRGTLKAAGMYRRGLRNTLDVRVRRQRVLLPSLPEAFDGFTVLHLSDLHLDAHPPVTDVLIGKIRALDYDHAVVTGDFRESTFESFDRAVELTLRLKSALPGPVHAVLGNHDFIEMTDPLEEAGLRFLINEGVSIRRGDDMIYLAGVDDPHFYETENLDKALSGGIDAPVRILLAHSPELYRKAAAGNVDLYLCGHTHGGQICLPGGVAVAGNVRCPRAFRHGLWRFDEMQGYTSVGAGASSVPVRYNCPPEITLIRLERGQL
ncbi:metallophosphoesterase [Kiritimatiella glycovorans]|uniref:Putative metallophosphoesterase n=1 Tax=Kiritimatiella glycovorans TaxID=1307763 RepID=A0A0G3EJY3_9BACT|nr:metallophosphoesterase [Kiritimatiella glycovorans]AKJ64439.1 putative metallophosphoesterase [Kiritimatiella glycovorans]